MFVFPCRPVVGDVSVIHPAAASFAWGAARTPGFAAAARDASKRRAYRQVSSTLHFVPTSAEFFGRLGAPALTLLRDLADQAVQAGRPGLSRVAFISRALRELSVALCRGNASLCRSGAYVATRAAGRTPMRGLARPLTEVVQACFAPNMWVWGFWFGFALRCVALLCGVCVRLHLVLFPAGGPFLSSLFVNLCRAQRCPVPGQRVLVSAELVFRHRGSGHSGAWAFPALG
jgi:hypothetical protein